MSATFNNAGGFLGHRPRECTGHETVGTHRAWCIDCSDWCYPDISEACCGCRIGSLRAELDELRAHNPDTRTPNVTT